MTRSRFVPGNYAVVLVAVQENLVTAFGQPLTDLLRPTDVGAGVTDEDVRRDCLPRPEGPTEKVNALYRRGTSNGLPK